MADKRDRCSNFTETDKELLMAIITENFFQVIENKKTDRTTVKEKNEAWENISDTFNAATTNASRTAIQLRNSYNNIKRKRKKDSANEKMEIYKTGGGPSCETKMSGTKVRRLSLLKPQIEPLYNEYDSSAEYIHISRTQETLPMSPVQQTPSTALEVTVVPDNISTNAILPPCTQDVSQANFTGKRIEQNTRRNPKRKLVDIYNSVENFTKTKILKNNIQKKKTELEIEILLKKKKREERQEINLLQIEVEKQKLLQQKLKTEQEVKLQFEKEKLKNLLTETS